MKTSINLFGSYNGLLMHATFEDNIFTVNERYRFLENGLMRCRLMRNQMPEASGNLRIKATSDHEPFRVTLHIWDKTFDFEAYQTGVVFIDPMIQLSAVGLPNNGPIEG